jgi:hypothetical protein
VGLTKSLQLKLDVMLSSTAANVSDIQDYFQPMDDVSINISDVSDSARGLNMSQVNSAGGLKLGLRRLPNRQANNQSLNETNFSDIAACDGKLTFGDASLTLSPKDPTTIGGSQTSGKRRHRLGNGHGSYSVPRKSARLASSCEKD